MQRNIAELNLIDAKTQYLGVNLQIKRKKWLSKW